MTEVSSSEDVYGSSDWDSDSDSNSDANLTPEMRAASESGMTVMEFRHTWHFFYHGKTEEQLAAVIDDSRRSKLLETVARQKEHCHWCQILALNERNMALKAEEGKKNHTMAMVYAEGNNLIVPKSFKFIEENILTGDIKLAEPEFLSGCSCPDDFDCLGSNCHCLQDVDCKDANIPKGSRRLNAYHIAGERRGCLRGWMLHSRYPIYECHDKCGCSNRCANRVVGKGRKVGLKVFPTEDGRGWGMYRPADSPKIIYS